MSERVIKWARIQKKLAEKSAVDIDKEADILYRLMQEEGMPIEDIDDLLDTNVPFENELLDRVKTKFRKDRKK